MLYENLDPNGKYVCYCATRNLYPLLPTILNALLYNTPKIDKVFCIIEDNNINYIKHPKVEFINVNNLNIQQYLNLNHYNSTQHWTYMANIRLIFSKFFSFKYLLYLDTDTIVVNDIISLWNLPLDNFACGVVAEKDRLISTIENYIPTYAATATISKLLNTDDYFNAGVMLFNLDYFRKFKLDDLCLKLINNTKYCFEFPDQDVLNIVCRNKFFLLDPHFNTNRFTFAKSVSSEKISNIFIRHYAEFIKNQEFWDTLDDSLYLKYKCDKLIE